MLSSLTGSSSSPLKKLTHGFREPSTSFWRDIRSEVSKNRVRVLLLVTRRVLGKSSRFSPEFVEVRAISSTSGRFVSNRALKPVWLTLANASTPEGSIWDNPVPSSSKRTSRSLPDLSNTVILNPKKPSLSSKAATVSSISNSAFQDFPSVLPS